MTRTARRGPENKRKHDATDWATLKPATQPPQRNKDKAFPENQRKQHHGPWKKGKGNLTGKRHKEEVLRTLLAKEKRREQRRQKRILQRESKKVCFKCRLPGHKVEECLMNDSNEGTGVCYRCGSTEHMSSACKAKGPKDQMPFANCYVCGKSGHLARSCPDNPRGLYPTGGGCRTCGSVEHFQRDCPEYLEKQGISSKTVKKINMEASVDAVDDDDDIAEIKTQQLSLKAPKKKKAKVIRF